ncbi:MAG: hypothetical protein JXX14_18470, partial [Deltaproteobacteria bacterium]|nr:hypothetical protein [Deltaproteobacteria bacterium]
MMRLYWGNRNEERVMVWRHVWRPTTVFSGKRFQKTVLWPDHMIGDTVIKGTSRICTTDNGWVDTCFRTGLWNVCLWAILLLAATGCGADIIVADEQAGETGVSDSDIPSTTDSVTEADTGTNTDIGSDGETSEDSDTSCPVLPAPVVMLSDSDAGAFTYFGEADMVWTAGDGQPVTGAWQVDTGRIIHTSTGTQLSHVIPAEIAAGDHMVAEFRVRCRASASGQCRTGMVIETAASPWQSMATYFFLTGPEWQLFQIPVVAGRSFTAEASRLTFRLGYENQSLDIYPSRLLNYGALDGDSRPECLPSSVSSSSPPAFLMDAPTHATVDILYDYFVEVTGLSPTVVTVPELPSWLTFDSAQNRLSGIPAYSDMDGPSTISLEARALNQTISQRIDVAVTVDVALVGHWPLDEISGAVATDASGNGRNGLVAGDPVWLPDDGRNGGALRCDATTGAVDYVLLPSDPVTDTVQSGPHTLAAWVRMESIPAGTVASDNNFGYGILIKPGFHTGLWYDSGQHFRASYEYDGKSYELIGPQTAPGEYHHVAAVFDPDAGNYLLYVDGQVVASDTLSGVDVYRDYGVEQWRIGVAAPDAATSVWGGDLSVDDVRIYSKALN